MLSTPKLQLSSSPLLSTNSGQGIARGFVSGRRFSLRLPQRRFASVTLQSENAPLSERLVTSNLNSLVGSSSAVQVSQWTLTRRHIHILSFMACAAAISATWLFVSAIPTLLAMRRAADSLAKLMDVTREELPDTMAAVRLSGMEISDLTMELSDIGQGLTQGVRSSTRAVRLAEESLRRMTNMTRSATMQEVVVRMETNTAAPALAKKARDLREGIVKGRSVLQTFFTLTGYSRAIFNFFASRAKTKSHKQ